MHPYMYTHKSIYTLKIPGRKSRPFSIVIDSDWHVQTQ